MSRPPLRVGLTGGIASGKSLVAGVLRDLGAAVVDADRIARQVTAPDGPAYADVVRAFGPDVVRPDGTLDRKALAARVFAGAEARRRINAITHPHIRRRLAEEAARLSAAPGVDAIVFDIPLLLDTTDGGDLALDGIIVVDAGEETRVRRLVRRDGLSEDDARRRIASQVPLAAKIARADWVIDNNRSPAETRAQVERLWAALRARRAAGRRDFSAPPDQRYFEDYLPGSVFEYGPIAVSQADILEFARRFDPQPFHVDPGAASRSPFGGLIASGWHTASLMMRLVADHYLSPVASLGSPGVDELRWTRPVRPGDSLRVRISVLEARRSRSKPDRGVVRSRMEVLNQNDDVVMSLQALNILRCRETNRE